MNHIKIPRQRIVWILAGGLSAVLLLAVAAGGVLAVLSLFRPPAVPAPKNVTGYYESFVREAAACDKTVTVEITHSENRPEELFVRFSFPDSGAVYYKYKKTAPLLRDLVAAQCGSLAGGFLNIRSQSPITRILVCFQDAASHTESFSRFELQEDGQAWKEI